MKHIAKITSAKQLEKLLAEQNKFVASAVVPFPRDTEAKQKRRIAKAKKDPFYFFKTYLPHYFTLEPNWHHKEMNEHTSGPNHITLIMGARETGKTVQEAVGNPLHKALHGFKKYYVFVAHTEDLATERLIAIRAELESNPRIIHDFGEQKTPGLWEMDDFTTKSGCKFKAFGYKGFVRGLLSGANRPDGVVVEDFESKATARNPKISKDKKEFLLEELYPIMGAGGNMVWLSNLPGKKCAAAMFRDETEEDENLQKNRSVLFYPLEYADGRLLWPEVKTREYCDMLRGTVGTLAYEREYKLNPIVEGNIFKESWFRQLTPLKKAPRSVIYLDPGFGQSKKACKKAAVLTVWSEAKYKTPDAWIRQSSITAWIDAVYAMWARWKGAGIGLNSIYCENNFAQIARLKHDLKEAAERHGYRLPINAYLTKENKLAKIEGKSGMVELGNAEFDLDNPDVKELKEELVHFPDYPFMDGADAWASSLNVLDTTTTTTILERIKNRTMASPKLNS